MIFLLLLLLSGTLSSSFLCLNDVRAEDVVDGEAGLSDSDSEGSGQGSEDDEDDEGGSGDDDSIGSEFDDLL